MARSTLLHALKKYIKINMGEKRFLRVEELIKIKSDPISNLLEFF